MVCRLRRVSNYGDFVFCTNMTVSFGMCALTTLCGLCKRGHGLYSLLSDKYNQRWISRDTIQAVTHGIFIAREKLKQLLSS